MEHAVSWSKAGVILRQPCGSSSSVARRDVPADVLHGFQRTTAGKFTTFDVPGAGTGAWQGTMPISISSEGAITGWYIDASGVNHGFIRLP